MYTEWQNIKVLFNLHYAELRSFIIWNATKHLIILLFNLCFQWQGHKNSNCIVRFEYFIDFNLNFKKIFWCSLYAYKAISFFPCACMLCGESIIEGKSCLNFSNLWISIPHIYHDVEWRRIHLFKIIWKDEEFVF